MFAFFQSADNIFDEPELTKEEKLKLMALLERFVNEMYQGRFTDDELLVMINGSKVMDYRSVDRKYEINWNYYKDKITDDHLRIFRSFNRADQSTICSRVSNWISNVT